MAASLFQKVQRIVEIDPGAQIYEGYSGRGMFGRLSSFAFTSECSPTSEEGRRFKKMGYAVDNMGRDWIYYARA